MDVPGGSITGLLCVWREEEEEGIRRGEGRRGEEGEGEKGGGGGRGGGGGGAREGGGKIPTHVVSHSYLS